MFNALENLTSESSSNAAPDAEPAPGTPSRSGKFVRTLAWAFTGFLLLALLAAQVLWVERDLFAQNPQLRPWMERFCNYLDCQLEPLRNLQSMAVVDSDLRTTPTGHHFLLNISLRNDADFPQPPPAIQVQLLNARDEAIGQRTFAPEEYLAYSGAIDRLLPGQLLQAVLELAASAQDEVQGYKIEIR